MTPASPSSAAARGRGSERASGAAMIWKRLLVPHDFSACAARALRLAVDLAKVQGSEVILLHVSDLPSNLEPETKISPEGEGQSLAVGDYATRGGRQRLEALAAPLRAAGHRVESVAVVGEIDEKILEAARELRADAIVIGTHGREGLSHLLLGSVAEKIVRRSPIPVVTVRTTAPEAELTPEEQSAEDELAG